MSIWKGLVVMLAASTLLSTSCTAFAAPPSGTRMAAISDQVDQVDGQRIMANVTALQNFWSRAFYLQSAENAAQYIFDAFRGMNLDVRYQNFTASGFPSSNVVATIPGTLPDEPGYLFGAHYDSFNSLSVGYSVGRNTSAPGADDDASGVASVMELALVLSELQLERSVTFVAFGAEELNADQTGGGLAGSSAFVTQAKSEGRAYSGTAVLDMIGFRDGPTNKCVLITRPDGNTLLGPTLQSVSDFGLDISLSTISEPNLSYSDHWPFWEAGYPSMLAIEELNLSGYYPVNPFYHSSDDKAYHLSGSQMENMTRALLGGLLYLDLVFEGEKGSDMPLVTALVIVIAAAAVAAAFLVFMRNRRG